MKKKDSSSLTFGDLFAGAGGISVGFHMAKFQSLFFNEINETAGRTHSLNFSDATPFVCPIQDLSAKMIRQNTALAGDDLDVMVGGPPCQGFSIYAHGRTTKDPRNSLFQHYVRLVLEGIRPKFVVLENVPGLVSLDSGGTVAAVKEAFGRAGYRMIYKILNAAHYGVPEERWRLLFLGTRLTDVDLSFPEPAHYSLQRPNFTGGREFTFRHAIRGTAAQIDLFQSRLQKPTTVQEALSDLPKIKSGGGSAEMPYSKAPETKYQELMRKGSKVIYNHECAGISPANLERLTFIKPGGSWRDIPHDLLPEGMKKAKRSDHTKRYGRLDPKGLSGTILTKCDPHWGTFYHYKQDRIISVREAARIQSFPDWFKFTGSKTEQYRDVGNAVPPLLARALALHIKKLLSQHNEAQDQSRTRKRRSDTNTAGAML